MQAPAGGASPVVVVVALAAAAVLLVALPAGASVGGAGEGAAISGLSRAALWLVLVGSGLTVLAARAAGRAVPLSAWLIPLLGVALAAVRMPVAVVALLLVAAMVLPRLAALPASLGWSRTLVLAGLAAGAAVSAGVAGRQHGDEMIAGMLVLAVLLATGMVPFGWHMLRWLETAPAELAALVVTALLPGVVAGMAATQPLLTTLHEAQRAGWLLGGFGAATAVAGAVYAMGARDWRSLAIRTVPGELGLALVGLAAFDIRGLQAAALTLAVLACTRPALMFVDAIGPRRDAGMVVTAVALVAAAGLPPSLGFPARLLVLSAAVRIHPALAGVVVAGMVLELVAIVVLLRRRLVQPPPKTPTGGDRSAGLLAAVTSLLLVGGGLFPGFLVRYVFNLAGA